MEACVECLYNRIRRAYYHQYRSDWITLIAKVSYTVYETVPIWPITFG